jgi:hypothetical protein
MNKQLLLSLVFIFLFSCKSKVTNEAVVYTNDFESNDLSGISNGVISQYNGSAVLGQYNVNENAGNFSLSLSKLPKHDIITISFDLYIHDSWDGNKTDPNGPDIWQMLVDGKTYINTTFSNQECIPGNFCSPQSYPLNYPNSNSNPKGAAYRTDLPGVCATPGANGTTEYKITKTFSHTSGTVVLQCIDKLVQKDSSTPMCDESWSVDNIKIKAITL